MFWKILIFHGNNFEHFLFSKSSLDTPTSPTLSSRNIIRAMGGGHTWPHIQIIKFDLNMDFLYI